MKITSEQLEAIRKMSEHPVGSRDIIASKVCEIFGGTCCKSRFNGKTLNDTWLDINGCRTEFSCYKHKPRGFSLKSIYTMFNDSPNSFCFNFDKQGNFIP